jgi:hypothetical protein
MPRYYIEDSEKHMFKDYESRKRNLYHILSEIGVSENFIWEQENNIEEASAIEREKHIKKIFKIMNEIEEKGGKTNLHDLYEYYGDKPSLWKIITQTQRLPERFIEKHFDKFDWRYICEMQILSEDFMRRNSERLDWWAVANFRKFSEEFYLEFYEQISKHVKYEKLRKNYQSDLANLKNESLKLLLAIREGYNGGDV